MFCDSCDLCNIFFKNQISYTILGIHAECEGLDQEKFREVKNMDSYFCTVCRAVKGI